MIILTIKRVVICNFTILVERIILDLIKKKFLIV